MPNDMLPNEMIYRVGEAIINDPTLVTILFQGMAGTRYPTQDPTSTPAIDIDSPNQLSSVVTDSAREGLMQGIVDNLAKRGDRVTSIHNPGSRDITVQGWPSCPMAVAWKLGAGFSEVILNKNPRDVVSSEKVKVKGVLRGVVKITVTFQEGYRVTGSGVLINDWTVATVGHLLVNTRGHAQIVEIEAGWGGGDDAVETRDGIYVAVHGKWYSKERLDPNDLGFIRLSKPFKTVNPIGYMQTPITHGTDAAIYGYPYDMPDDVDARGNRLCVSRSPVRYCQSDSTGMLEHEGDTEKGTSGGPVLDANGIVIALHRGWTPDGSSGEAVNQAVAIDRNGNDFWAFCLILERTSQSEDDRVKRLGEVKEVNGFAFAW